MFPLNSAIDCINLDPEVFTDSNIDWGRNSWLIISSSFFNSFPCLVRGALLKAKKCNLGNIIVSTAIFLRSVFNFPGKRVPHVQLLIAGVNWSFNYLNVVAPLFGITWFTPSLSKHIDIVVFSITWCNESTALYISTTELEVSIEGKCKYAMNILSGYYSMVYPNILVPKPEPVPPHNESGI